MNRAEKTTRRWPKAPETAAAGFSLLEVAAGMIFVTLALLGLGVLFISSERSHETATEESVIAHTFRLTAERMRGTPFADIAAKFQNYQFTVGHVQGTGSVRVFLDETESSADAQELGLPRDLDGDGSATSTDVSAGYVLLPVMIRIDWTNPSGVQTRKLHFLLSQEE